MTRRTVFNSLRLVAVGALLALTAQANATNHPKAYSTGEQLSKPWQLSRFVEYTNARTPPVLDFTNLDGDKVDWSQYRGKLLMVNIWATWCAPCLKELPELQQVQAHFAGKPLAIQPISVDEVLTEVAPMLEKYNLTSVDTWLDPEMNMPKIMPTETVPATYFFDGNGNIVGFMRGYIEWLDPDVLEYVGKLIDKYAEPDFAK